GWLTRSGETRRRTVLLRPRANRATVDKPRTTMRQSSGRQYDQAGRLNRVLHERGHRHRPYPAGDRRDPAGSLRSRLEVQVALKLAVGPAIDTDIDDDRTVGNP